MNNVIVWSKAGCGFCTRAVSLLEAKKIPFELRTIGVGWSKQQLLESVPSAQTVPQIIIDGKAIGGFTELYQLLDKGSSDVIRNSL
jgi:glutaredoxin 3